MRRKARSCSFATSWGIGYIEAKSLLEFGGWGVGGQGGGGRMLGSAMVKRGKPVVRSMKTSAEGSTWSSEGCVS